jgi:hypothetical protein
MIQTLDNIHIFENATHTQLSQTLYTLFHVHGNLGKFKTSNNKAQILKTYEKDIYYCEQLL